MQVSIASTIRAMVILLISALVSVMTLKTSFNLSRSLCHPSTTQTSRLIISPTTILCLPLLGVYWLRSLVFVIAFHKSFSFQCVFQFRSVFVISIQYVFVVSIQWVFQFIHSFNWSKKWFAMFKFYDKFSKFQVDLILNMWFCMFAHNWIMEIGMKRGHYSAILNTFPFTHPFWAFKVVFLSK